MSRNHVRGCTCTRRGYYCAVDRSTPTEYPEAMGGGASKAEKQAAVSEETSTAIEGLSALERMLREPELPPAAVEASTTQATAPAVDEKNAALVAQAAEKPAEPPQASTPQRRRQPSTRRMRPSSLRRRRSRRSRRRQ